MSGVRLLVGTKKGAFVLTADGKRQKWKVDGPHFGGWEMYHLKGSPLDPASYDPAGGSHLVTKMGIDATRKSNYPDEVMVPDADRIDMAAFIPGYGGPGRLKG